MSFGRKSAIAFFDLPTLDERFERRLAELKKVVHQSDPAFAQVHPHIRCRNATHLQEELARIEAARRRRAHAARAGLALSSRSVRPRCSKSSGSRTPRRALSATKPGCGRHQGRLGALVVEWANGVRFAVGTGLTDAERQSPPPIGSVITFRYQELSDAGVPRFPSYVGVREETQGLPLLETGASAMSASAKRRFKYVEGSSDKFWEVELVGTCVAVRFGRNGTQGQTQTKLFNDESAAQKHIDKLVQQKTGKGYVEVA